MSDRLKSNAILGAAALLAGIVFWVDTVARYDFAISVLYLAVLVLVSFAANAKAVVRAAQICVALAILAWFIGHSADPSVASALRCVVGCTAISVTAALLVSRKRLETIKRDLERSRSEVELFANSVPFVLWRSNPQGEIEYLNQSWTTVTGLDRVSVLEGQRYNDVVHPDDIPILNETVSKAVATRTVTDLKVRVRQADGSYRWMQIYDNPAYSPLSGQVERFGGLSDVHNEVIAKEQLQKVRAELEESRRELVNFTNSVPQILWRADRQANVDFYNERFTEVTGRDLNAVIAKQDWIEDFHPDDRAAYLANLEKSFSAGKELRETFRLRHANGTYRWMSLVGRPVPIADGSDEIRYYGGVSDIHDEVSAHQKVRELNETLEQRVSERTSELLRTERRYAGLFDVSNMSFAEVDFSAAERRIDALKAEGVTDLRAYMSIHPDALAETLAMIRIVRVNEAMARLLGYDDAVDLTSHPPAELAEDGAELLLRQLEMYFNGIDHIDGPAVLVGKGGKRIPVYYNVTRLPDGLHLASQVDLTDQMRIEEMRRAAQSELARANRVATVGALSASIAHELNQPIASILIDAQTGLRLALRDGPDIEKVANILQRVERTAQRVARIVQRTRENIVAGRRAVQDVDLLRLAEETRELLAHDLALADARLEISSESEIPTIKGDPVELQQILVNLVTNAIDAMRDQSGPRRIGIELMEEVDTVRARVTDTGPGIPDANLEKLFDPFFTTKATGIGMGLQICRSAIESMGGQLTVANIPGGGACFSFDLPIATTEDEAASVA
ncbi:PAS domain-containing protein (plasmid) [Novosphingobium resinovorum]|uniref:PAS domain-containing sensor histidine kinase n=1 Tax=Novosphingobium TaxID=165696 RepID=UPI001B3C96A1|nr:MULTISPECIES: PAS domain-containing protein [Novosphingobium]WJM29733.1 PAS domain-containing protein [Novosphingobium resinovorum]